MYFKIINQKKMKTIIIFFYLALIAGSSYLQAQSGVIVSDTKGWTKIGQKSVNFLKQKDRIKVIGADRFTAVKFSVKNAPFKLNKVELVFENGDKQTVNYDANIKEEGESSVIDIDGKERCLKTIGFTYSPLTTLKDKNAQLEIWGCKTNENKKVGSGVATRKIKKGISTSSSSSSSSVNNGAINNQDVDKNKISDANGLAVITKDTTRTPAFVTVDKWRKIAERTVDFKFDKDEIVLIGTNTFTSIKLKALDAPIVIYDLKLQFENGERQDISFNSQIDPGMETSVIYFDNGMVRNLTNISFMYKTAPNAKDEKANIEILGFKSNTQNIQSLR